MRCLALFLEDGGFMGNPFNYIAINLTNRCNTYCKYCFQSATATDQDYLDFETVKNILDYTGNRADADKKRIIHLTGGEPTMNHDFFKILEYVIQKGFVVRIQSNGLSWNRFRQEDLELLRNKNVSIKISLDGWNAETHEFLRAPNTFELIKSNIQLLTHYCRMVGIKTCVHEKNIDELGRMLEVCKELSVQGFSYSILRREGEALHHVPEQEFQISEVTVAEKLIPLFNKPEYQYLMNGNNLLLYYYTGGNIRYQPHFYVDYDGNVYPHQSCVQEECMGNVLKEGNDVFVLEKALEWGHSHEVNMPTVAYVKEHFQPRNKRG